MTGVRHGYRGVTMRASSQYHAFQAQIKHQGKVLMWPRRFQTPEEAARVFDVMEIYLRGPDAQPNFDGQPPTGVTRQEIKHFLARRGVLPPCWYHAEPPQFVS